MAVTDFRSLKSDLVNRNILNTDYFAEELTFLPIDSQPRTIDAKVTRQGETEYADAGDEAELEIVRVFCRNDATLGISLPQLGDKLQRAASVEQDNRPYTFHEELRRESTDTHLVLLFARGKQTGRSPTG